ncbi:protein kinase, putative [Entamoeba nuttalli P19]|uniref:Protein kinase, putative n=2 Tax=Entamoeba nuttalli TaxID=412467 RepID=K2HWR8_ENTNP|nr:protein kinase, putative [Entamoeba nuttalli P19]EKE40685.1 protein kinase, putative [Entamoeba nuttalli P19]|eukprot:XP_008856977.1 protein kinase, putative [Entamoeba nuttalli P19]
MSKLNSKYQYITLFEMPEIKTVIEAPNDNNSPPIGIYGHSTCYGDCKMYVYGGWIDSEKKYNSCLYIFDFESLKWKKVKLDIQFERAYHTATYYKKKIYLVGGLQYEEIMKGIDVIDTENYSIEKLKIVLGEVPGKYFHSTVLYKGALYIYGGRTNSKKSNDVEVFSKDFIKFDIDSSSSFILGGKDEDLYREKHGCFITSGGNMYIIGGYTTKGESVKISRFNIDTQRWFECSNFDCPKNELRFGYFKNEDVAISVYGNKGEEPMDDIYYYDVHGMGSEKMIKGNIKNSLMEQKTWGNTLIPFSFRNGGSFFIIIGGEKSTKPMIVCSIENKNMKWEDLKKVVEEEKLSIPQQKIIVNEELYYFLKKNNLTHLIEKLLEAKINDYNTLHSSSTALLIKAGIKKGYAIQLSAAIAKEDGLSSSKLHGKYEYLTDCEVGEKLGNGAFGVVCKGMWLGTTPVAMKAVNGALDKPEKLIELEKEATITQLMKHPNLITMYGLYKEKDTIFMILDLAEGSLDKLMSRENPKNERANITFKKQIKMAIDCASGMAYLESLRIVHRDLALRNLLYIHDDKGGYITKIADLGLSRQTADGNYTTQSKIFPKRWTAPEAGDPNSPSYLQFNTKSDVWSYGVVFWEILTKGIIPYSSISKAQDALDAVIKGLRLEKPTILEENGSVGDKVWEVITSCFNSPDKRPRFRDCFKSLTEIYDSLQEEVILPPPQEESDDGGYE